MMNTEQTDYVWDPLVRMFHWVLVTAFAVAWMTEDAWLDLHELAGYTIGGLLLLRLFWGLIGPRHARFSDFVRPPREVAAYLADVVRFRARRYVGHNPAGGAMVLALLACLLLTVVSGVLTLGFEEFRGPAAGFASAVGDGVADGVEETHELFANLTLLLVFAHVAGVLLASFQHHENLVRAMVTGRKPRVTDH
jgi:cytochrome b